MKKGYMGAVMKHVWMPSQLNVTPRQRFAIRSTYLPSWYRYKYSWNLVNQGTGADNFVSLALFPPLSSSAVTYGDVSWEYWGTDYVGNTFVNNAQFYLSWLKVKVRFYRVNDGFRKRLCIARMKRNVFPQSGTQNARTGWNTDMDSTVTTTKGWNILYKKTWSDVPKDGMYQFIADMENDEPPVGSFRRDYSKWFETTFFFPVHRVFRTHDGYNADNLSDWLAGSNYDDWTYLHFDHQYINSNINPRAVPSQVVDVFYEYYVLRPQT